MNQFNNDPDEFDFDCRGGVFRAVAWVFLGYAVIAAVAYWWFASGGK